MAQIDRSALHPPERIEYGPDESQFGELYLPDSDGPYAVVVLIHGGFWRSMYGLGLMAPLATDLQSRGYGVWNIEYRRVGEAGGGYPGTLEDVAAAIDVLATLRGADLDVGRVALVGHSAGGHLALWAAGRDGVGSGAPGANAAVRPKVVVSLAGVANLDAAAADRYSNGATQDFVGGELHEVPERYDIAQPNFDAMTARVLAVHGDADESVPISQSFFASAYGAEMYPLEGVGHMEVIDPRHDAWAIVTRELGRELG